MLSLLKPKSKRTQLYYAHLHNSKTMQPIKYKNTLNQDVIQDGWSLSKLCFTKTNISNLVGFQREYFNLFGIYFVSLHKSVSRLLIYSSIIKCYTCQV